MRSADLGRTASSQRCEPGSVNIPIGTIPATAGEAPNADVDAIASKIINSLNGALQKSDYQAVGALFVEEGYLRDHLTLTWELRTLKGRDKIVSFLEKGQRVETVEIDRSSAYRSPHIAQLDTLGTAKGIEFFIKLSTKLGNAQGVVLLVQQPDGEWKIWTFFTSLRELKGFEEPLNGRRSKGVQHGENLGRKNWLERRTATTGFEDSDPVVLIVGS